MGIKRGKIGLKNKGFPTFKPIGGGDPWPDPEKQRRWPDGRVRIMCRGYSDKVKPPNSGPHFPTGGGEHGAWPFGWKRPHTGLSGGVKRWPK